MPLDGRLVTKKPYYQSAVMPDLEDFIGYCDGDLHFARWCQEVNRLALRFVSITFFEVEQQSDPEECFSGGYTPIQFVRRCIVPEMVCDCGYDHVEDVVADNIMWGTIL